MKPIVHAGLGSMATTSSHKAVSAHFALFAHRIAGYPGTLDDTLNAQKGSLEKTAELLGVLRVVIDNINAGKMKLVMRVKGAKKKGCWMCSTMSSSAQSKCRGLFGWL